jgi:DNA polymerase-3 subunit beta
VATDTHRLASIESVVLEGHGSHNAIIPSRAMNELTRLLTDAEGDVQVILSNNQIQFDLPGDAGIQIVSRLIEGQFPNFQRVIPTNHTRRLKIPSEPLLRATRRAFIVARENSNRVILKTVDDKLVLTAESQTVGNAYEEVEIEKEGDDIQVAFNSKYLLDVLSVVDTDSVYLELTEPLKPGVMRPAPAQQAEGDEATIATAPDYLCVLMPMQLA